MLLGAEVWEIITRNLGDIYGLSLPSSTTVIVIGDKLATARNLLLALIFLLLNYIV